MSLAGFYTYWIALICGSVSFYTHMKIKRAVILGATRCQGEILVLQWRLLDWIGPPGCCNLKQMDRWRWPYRDTDAAGHSSRRMAQFSKATVNGRALNEATYESMSCVHLFKSGNAKSISMQLQIHEGRVWRWCIRGIKGPGILRTRERVFRPQHRREWCSSPRVRLQQLLAPHLSQEMKWRYESVISVSCSNLEMLESI